MIDLTSKGVKVFQTNLVHSIKCIKAHSNVSDDRLLDLSCKDAGADGELGTGPFDGWTGLPLLIRQLAVEGFPYECNRCNDCSSSKVGSLYCSNWVVDETL